MIGARNGPGRPPKGRGAVRTGFLQTRQSIDLIARLDAVRGDRTRSEIVQEALERWLSSPASDPAGNLWPSPVDEDDVQAWLVSHWPDTGPIVDGPAPALVYTDEGGQIYVRSADGEEHELDAFSDDTIWRRVG